MAASRVTCGQGREAQHASTASAECASLAERAGRLEFYVTSHSLPGAGRVMGTIRAAIGKLNQAFGL